MSTDSIRRLAYQAPHKRKTFFGFGMHSNRISGKNICQIIEEFIKETENLYDQEIKILRFGTLDKFSTDDRIKEIERYFSCPCLFFSVTSLKAYAKFLKKPSERVFAKIQCYGVAESAALAVCGKGGFLLREKTVKLPLTLAISQKYSIQ